MSDPLFTLSSGVIRATRLRLNITQEQLALMLGVSPPKVNRWETEKEVCRGLHAERLAQLEGRARKGHCGCGTVCGAIPN